MKKIMIIGAGFLQSFVIRKAKELGYYTITVDGNSNAEGFEYADEHRVISIVNESECLEYAREKKIDGVMTAATDYGVLTVAHIAKELGLKALSYDVAKLIKNKYQIRKCLYQNSVDDTEQSYEVDENADIDELSLKLKYPVMVKPCDGSGSRGAARVDYPDELKIACINAINSSLTARAEIETFIKGQEYGVESYVINGEIYVLGVMRKTMTSPPYYAELGHAIPSGLTTEREMYIKQCVRKAIKALGVNFGSVNMDLIMTEEGKVYIIDIGARMGGNMIGPSIIPNGTGIDYVSNAIRAVVGDEVDFSSKGETSVATRLLAFAGGVVTALPDFDALEKKHGVKIYHHISIGDKINEYHTNLDGCGYIVATANNVQQAEENAKMTLDEISAKIYEE